MTFQIKRLIWGTHSIWSKGSIVMGPQIPKVALTFDDGPSEEWTQKICSILASRNAKASFFMIGKHVEKLPSIAKEVVSQGHEACVHLYSHRRDSAKNRDLFDREVKKSTAIIQDATGLKPSLLRFPFARMGNYTAQEVYKKHGLRTVHWSFSSMDSRGDAQRIVDKVSRWIFPGAIVLFHDGVGGDSKYAKSRDATLEALPSVLDAVSAMGFEAVTVSELIRSS